MPPASMARRSKEVEVNVMADSDVILKKEERLGRRSELCSVLADYHQNE
jgi:hypothetical protein